MGEDCPAMGGGGVFMPIGKYKDFASCVAAMKRKGKTEESAQRICGKIEQDTQKSKLENRIIKATKDE